MLYSRYQSRDNEYQRYDLLPFRLLISNQKLRICINVNKEVARNSSTLNSEYISIEINYERSGGKLFHR